MEHLQVIAQQNDVQVIWIPGHEGFSGNEEADSLAKRRAANTQDTNKEDCSVSLRKRIKNWLYDTASSVWKKSATTKHSKEVLSHYSVQRKDLLLKLNRIEVQRIIAFTTGHGRFNAHLKKMNITSDSKCKFC